LPDNQEAVGIRLKDDAPRPGEDPDARFARIHAEHWQAVLGYALRRTRGPEEAAEVVSETFLVAWRRAGTVPPEPHVRTWLYAVARRVLANQLRGERRRVRLVERLGENLTQALPAESTGADGSPAMRALARLHRKDREVLMLAGWEELKPTQIAVVLGISPVAARSRLHRARRRFRRELEADAAASARSCVDLEIEQA
jgi:RNA polymerase sigma-70 factor (ECF subfamily)